MDRTLPHLVSKINQLSSVKLWSKGLITFITSHTHSERGIDWLPGFACDTAIWRSKVLLVSLVIGSAILGGRKYWPRLQSLWTTMFSQGDRSQLFSLTEVALCSYLGDKFSISHQLLFYLLKPVLGVWEGVPQVARFYHYCMAVKNEKLLAKYTISVEDMPWDGGYVHAGNGNGKG